MMRRKRLFLAVLAVAVIGGIVWFLTRPDPNAKINFAFPKSLTSTQELSVPLRISSGTAANAAEFYFHFPTNLLEVDSIDKTGSFFALWVKDSPSFDNTTGLIYIAGGLPTPGFKGADGLVATVKFKVKAAGSGTITLDTTKSRILANDGVGTQIPAPFTSIPFTIR